MTGATRRAAVWVAALVFATAGDVAARGGGRGGGGRGGGFSRGGAAAGGSLGQGRRAGGTQRGGYYNTHGPAASGTFEGRSNGERREQYQQNAEQRQQQRNEAREDWQNYGTNRREDWQDYADDHDDDHYHDGAEYPYGAAVVAGAAVGAALGAAVAPPPYWTLDCTPTTVVVGATTYYQCGSAWYVRAYSGGDVAYTMVNPPAGY